MGKRRRDRSRDAGFRVANLTHRYGADSRGGARPPCAPLGCTGGSVGDGETVHELGNRDDLVAAIRFILESDELDGPVNAVAPGPSTTRSLRGFWVLRCSSDPFSVPAFAVRLLSAKWETTCFSRGESHTRTSSASGFSIRARGSGVCAERPVAGESFKMSRKYRFPTTAAPRAAPIPIQRWP